MQYILTQQEIDALTPVARLQECNEALEVACRMLVTKEECKKIHYCNDCPIGQIYNQKVRNHICVRPKYWAK